jgi:SAM-dependent methyltransferase
MTRPGATSSTGVAGSAPEPDEVARIRAAYRSYGEGEALRRWSVDNPGNRRMIDERDELLRTCALRLGEPSSIIWLLDVGCGDGRAMQRLHQAIEPRRSIGVDIRMDRLARARGTGADGVEVVGASAMALSIRSEAVEVVSLMTILSSVLDPDLRSVLACEVDRVLVPGGLVLWHDLRRSNPRNPHVTAIDQDELARLFPGWTMDLHPVTLLPPLARRLGRFTPALYPRLGRLTWLRSHLGGALRKPG